MARPNRIRRLLVVVAALVVAAALVSPIVLTNHGGPSTSACHPTLRFRGRDYERRAVSGASLTQGIATGAGVLRGCGQSPSNANVRSLIGIPSARAIAIDGDTHVYVRRGICAGLGGDRLAGCLRG